MIQIILNERHESLQRMTDETTTHPAPRVKKEMEAKEMHRQPGMSVDELMPVLGSSTADLRASAEKALRESSDWLNVVNHSRWRSSLTAAALPEREANIANLRAALTEFRESKQFLLLEPFREAFDSTGTLKPEGAPFIRHYMRDLHKCHVFTTNLIAFVLSLLDLLALLLEVEKANPKARMQLPSKFAEKLMESANEKGTGENPLDMGATNVAKSDRDSTQTLVKESNSGKKDKKTKSVRKFGTSTIRFKSMADFGCSQRS